MKISGFLIIKAIISLVFGIGFVLIPSTVMSMYGVTLDAGGNLVGQFAGAALIGIGLICWFARQADKLALRSITQSLFIGDTIGFIVALIGQLGGVMNGLGWITVAIWLFLALGLGYFRFLSSEIA
jgi:hypothetical protein